MGFAGFPTERKLFYSSYISKDLQHFSLLYDNMLTFILHFNFYVVI